MKSCLNTIESLRIKLRMFGVPFEGPTQVYCDNERAVLNSSKVESALDKKNNSVTYHYICNSDNKLFICGMDCSQGIFGICIHKMPGSTYKGISIWQLDIFI